MITIKNWFDIVRKAELNNSTMECLEQEFDDMLFNFDVRLAQVSKSIVNLMTYNSYVVEGSNELLVQRISDKGTIYFKVRV